MKPFPTSPALRKTSLREVCTSPLLSISLRSMSILLIPANIFLIWSTQAGYEEIAGGFKPTRNGETFQMNNNYVHDIIIMMIIIIIVLTLIIIIMMKLID